LGVRKLDDTMILVEWNVNRSSITRFSTQLTALGAMHDQLDVVILVEVGKHAARQAKINLQPLGLLHSLFSQDLLPEHISPTVSGVMIASRWPLNCQDLWLDVPFPDRLLTAVIDSPYDPIEATAFHAPPGSQYGIKKIEMFEAVATRLGTDATGHRLLAGDFNSPARETTDGDVIVFGARNSRWQNGERSLFVGLADFDLSDVFRAVNGFEKFAWSHQLKRKGVLKWQRRFDHVLASSSLHAVQASYLHELDAYSDHTPLLIKFDPEQPSMTDSSTIFNFDIDVREPGDEPRLSRFKVGWKAGANGERYSPTTLARLTWQNLGWRYGYTIGDINEHQIIAIFNFHCSLQNNNTKE